MNLQLEVLDDIEAPLSNMEGAALVIWALDAGLLVGIIIAT